MQKNSSFASDCCFQLLYEHYIPLHRLIHRETKWEMYNISQVLTAFPTAKPSPLSYLAIVLSSLPKMFTTFSLKGGRASAWKKNIAKIMFRKKRKEIIIFAEQPWNYLPFVNNEYILQSTRVGLQHWTHYTYFLFLWALYEGFEVCWSLRRCVHKHISQSFFQHCPTS